MIFSFKEREETLKAIILTVADRPPMFCKTNGILMPIPSSAQCVNCNSGPCIVTISDDLRVDQYKVKPDISSDPIEIAVEKRAA